MRIRCVDDGFRLTLSFGYHDGYPLNNGYHYGTDYVHENRFILSPQDSRVVAKGYDKTNGNYLVLENGDYRDWFSHIDKYKINLGENVKAGQIIAIMGDTGYATGVHVHHSVRVKGVLTNAEDLIGNKIMIENTSAWKTRMSQVLREITGEKLTDKEFQSWVGAEPFSIVEALIDDTERAKQNDLSNYEVVSETLYRRKK